MRLRTHTASSWYKHELENFHTRLIARLCVILLCVTQIGQRLFFVLDEPNLSRDSKIFYLASLPFLVFVSIIVGIEFILFKKIGTKIIKYSRIIDLVFFFTFIGEWFFTLHAAVIKASYHTGLSYSIPAVFGFTSFSWRTQLQSFVTQRWYLKCIPTMMAYILVMVYAIKFDPRETIYTLIRGILQILYVVLYFYFEDKIKLRMLLINMHQEKWMQINEFILNNIPENIAIIDVSGEAKFISDNFKNFIIKCCGDNNALSVKEFCEKIQNLEQYDFEANAASSSNNDNRVLYFPFMKFINPLFLEFIFETFYFDFSRRQSNQQILPINENSFRSDLKFPSNDQDWISPRTLFSRLQRETQTR